MPHIDYITDKKLVLKAAQSVWAANKYFVLACNQQQYIKIRRLLRPDNGQLHAAYKVLKSVDATFSATPSESLPELSNALYHVAGYFKKYFSDEKRQATHHLIQTDPAQALNELEEQTKEHQIDYLLPARLWSSQRTTSFDQVPAQLSHQGATYPPYTSSWRGDVVLVQA